MGIDLVKAAHLPEWSSLGLAARYVLDLMCAKALDTPNPAGDEPRRYFAGTDYLVLVLTGSRRGDPGYQAGKRKVERALLELRRAGAIEELERGRPGHYARYKLMPDRSIQGKP